MTATSYINIDLAAAVYKRGLASLKALVERFSRWACWLGELAQRAQTGDVLSPREAEVLALTRRFLRAK